MFTSLINSVLTNSRIYHWSKSSTLLYDRKRKVTPST